MKKFLHTAIAVALVLTAVFGSATSAAAAGIKVDITVVEPDQGWREGYVVVLQNKNSFPAFAEGSAILRDKSGVVETQSIRIPSASEEEKYVPGHETRQYFFPWQAPLKGGPHYLRLELTVRQQGCRNYVEEVTVEATFEVKALASLKASIDCSGVSFAGNTEVDATITYVAYAGTGMAGDEEVTLEGSLKVAAGEFSEFIPLPEELLSFDPYEMRVEAELNGPYDVHAEATAEDKLICNAPGPANLMVDIDCQGIYLTGTSDVGGIVDFRATADGVSLEGMLVTLPGFFNEFIPWSEKLMALDPYKMRVKAKLTGPYGVHVSAETEDELICNLPGEATVSAYTDCFNDPIITVRSDDGGAVEYNITATSEDGSQIVEVRGEAEVEAGEETIIARWGVKFDRLGTYTFNYRVVFRGRHGSYAENEGTLDQVCNEPPKLAKIRYRKVVRLPVWAYRLVAEKFNWPFESNGVPPDTEIEVPAGDFITWLGSPDGLDRWYDYMKDPNTVGSRTSWTDGYATYPWLEPARYALGTYGFAPNSAYDWLEKEVGGKWVPCDENWEPIPEDQLDKAGEPRSIFSLGVGEYRDDFVFRNRLVVPTPQPPVKFEGGPTASADSLFGAEITGRITAENFDLPVVEGVVDSNSRLAMANNAFTHLSNRQGADIYVVHATEADLTNLNVGDEVEVNYRPYKVVDKQIIQAGEEDLNTVGEAGQKVLGSCLGEKGNWHSRIFLIAEPLN